MLPNEGEPRQWRDRGRGLMWLAIATNASIASFLMLAESVLTPVIPILCSLLPLLARDRGSTVKLRAISTLLILGFAWLGLASVGLLFLPGALLMAAAVART